VETSSVDSKFMIYIYGVLSVLRNTLHIRRKHSFVFLLINSSVFVLAMSSFVRRCKILRYIIPGITTVLTRCVTKIVRLLECIPFYVPAKADRHSIPREPNCT
jgi:hypothetical protein